MANKVSFIIQLKDQFSGTGKKLNRMFDAARRKAKELDTALRSRLKNSLSGINKQALSAAKGVATLASAMKTVRVGAGFEDAIAELSAITGAEGGDLRALSDDVMRAAKTFGISQDIVAQAFTQTASAKSELLKTPGAVATVTAEALRLSKAAGIEVPEAIRASIGGLNQWSVGADQAARFVNVLAAGAKVGASQVGETAEALKNAGTVAAQFGLTFESTNAILQVFAKNEIKGAEAGTALRGTLSKLEKFAGGRFAPSKLGIIKSLQMIERLGLSNTQVIKEFGEENLRSILVLRKNIPLVKQWTRELTGTNIASKQASTRLDTFNAKVTKAGVALKSVAIKIFNGFEPILSGAVELFTFLINAIEGVTAALGNLLGQSLGALFTMDLGAFDFKSIASSFGEAFGLEALPEIKAAIELNTIKITQSPLKAADVNVIQSPLKSGDIKVIQAQMAAAPAVAALRPPVAANGRIDGEIVVSAAPGARVRETNMKSAGNGLNVGMNMAAAS